MDFAQKDSGKKLQIWLKYLCPASFPQHLRYNKYQGTPGKINSFWLKLHPRGVSACDFFFFFDTCFQKKVKICETNCFNTYRCLQGHPWCVNVGADEVLLAENPIEGRGTFTEYMSEITKHMNKFQNIQQLAKSASSEKEAGNQILEC